MYLHLSEKWICNINLHSDNKKEMSLIELWFLKCYLTFAIFLPVFIGSTNQFKITQRNRSNVYLFLPKYIL